MGLFKKGRQSVTEPTRTELADSLGLIKAKIEDLVHDAEGIEKQLMKMGVGAYEGNLFRAVVMAAYRQKALSPTLAKKYLSLSEIQKCSRWKNIGQQVRILARNGKP